MSLAGELNRVLWKLKADPRIPGFQGLQISTGGGVHVVHQWGCVPFRSLQDFLDWVEGGPKTRNADEENPS